MDTNNTITTIYLTELVILSKTKDFIEPLTHHIKFVADMLLCTLGYAKLYNTETTVSGNCAIYEMALIIVLLGRYQGHLNRRGKSNILCIDDGECCGIRQRGGNPTK